MATIINSKPVATPLIPLANPSGVSIPSSAMAAIESAMANPHIGTNKVNSKKSKKKAKKQQKTAQAAVYKNTVSVPTQDVEVVEADITEPVKEEAKLPEVTTPSIVIAHTEERKSVKATFPSEGIQNMITDFRGMKDAIIAHHNNGEILPEGFADAVREVADTIAAIDLEDSKKRGISLNKEVYTDYREPKYDIKGCRSIYGDEPSEHEYVRFMIPLVDHAFINGKIGDEYPAESGRSVLKTVSDNIEFVSDNEFFTINGLQFVYASSPMATSGLIMIPCREDYSEHRHSVRGNADFLLDVYIPNSKVSAYVSSSPIVFVLSNSDAHIISTSCSPNINRLHLLEARALTIGALEEILSDMDVEIRGIRNYYPLDKYGHARPAGRASDGNIIISSIDDCDLIH